MHLGSLYISSLCFCFVFIKPTDSKAFGGLPLHYDLLKLHSCLGKGSLTSSQIRMKLAFTKNVHSTNL